MTHCADADASERQLMGEAGYAPPAIAYYQEKKYMGNLPDADQVTLNIGSCGDVMKIYLKVDADGRIEDIRYEITGCAGAISAAMATVDLARGKTLDEALQLNDGDVFKALEGVPAKKHHCIQLAVKTLHQGVKDYLAEQKSR
ncbi:MAG: iron-sulfur cluster assembly scaffold protein [Desulfobulbus sp.]